MQQQSQTDLELEEMLPRANARPGRDNERAIRFMPAVDLTVIETVTEKQREEMANGEPCEETREAVEATVRRIRAAKLAKHKSRGGDSNDC